ncbi:MAG: Ig-like domain-containing protein, partial [Pseudomonadota bacterium]
VTAGRALKLAFNNGDVAKREIVKEDLVLDLTDGGKVILKDYMVAFGLIGDVKTEVVQLDGKVFSLTDLLTPAAGTTTKTATTPTPTDTPAVTDVFNVDKPDAGVTRTIRLPAGRRLSMGFNENDVASATTGDNGALIIKFTDGGQLVISNFLRYLQGDTDAEVLLSGGRTVKLVELPTLLGTGAGGDPEDDGAFYTAYDPGALPPGIEALPGLPDELLRFSPPDPRLGIAGLQGGDSVSNNLIDDDDPTANPDTFDFGPPVANPDEGPTAPPQAFAAFQTFAAAGFAPEPAALNAGDPGVFELEVLQNDSDPDGDILTIVAINGQPVEVDGATVTTASGAEIGIAPSDLGDPTRLHQVLFDPADDFFGTEVFTYTITDGNGGTTSTTTVTIRIPADWTIEGESNDLEGNAFDYTVAFAGQALEVGQTRSIDVTIELAGGQGEASPADFDQAFFDALQAAAAGQNGVSVTDLGGGVVRVTFDPTVNGSAFNFSLQTIVDDITEGDEVFIVSLSDPTSTGGAIAGGVVPEQAAVESIIEEGPTPFWSLT